MQCKERSSLLIHYQKRVRAYAHAVTALRQEQTTVTQSEFKRVWNLTELALRACSASQRKLERHILTHQCDTVPDYATTESAVFQAPR